MAKKTNDIYLLAEPYANALLDLAEETKSLDETAIGVTQLKALIAESSDLTLVLRSPVIDRHIQKNAVEAVLERAGASQRIRNFVGVVAANRRLFALAAIIETFLSELAKRRGEQLAALRTAKPLSKAQQSHIDDALQRAFGPKVQVTASVDPSLIGGLELRIGSILIDDSLKTKLNRLEAAMKGSD